MALAGGYDIAIVGAGTAGFVLAARLSATQDRAEDDLLPARHRQGVDLSRGHVAPEMLAHRRGVLQGAQAMRPDVVRGPDVPVVAVHGHEQRMVDHSRPHLGARITPAWFENPAAVIPPRDGPRLVPRPVPCQRPRLPKSGVNVRPWRLGFLAR